MKRNYHTRWGLVNLSFCVWTACLSLYWCQRSACKLQRRPFRARDRSDGSEQMHMVWSWQVSDRAGSDRRSQLHMVHGWEVPNWIRSFLICGCESCDELYHGFLVWEQNVCFDHRALQSIKFRIPSFTWWRLHWTGLITEDNCTWCTAGKYQTGSGPNLLLVPFPNSFYTDLFPTSIVRFFSCL